LLAGPSSVAVAPDGTIYIGQAGQYISAYQQDCGVRKVTPDGIITTVVGGPGKCWHSGDGGLASEAQTTIVRDVALGPDGSLYLLETNAVRRVGTNGIITTVAGDCRTLYYGDCREDHSDGSGDGGPATNAKLKKPLGITIGPDGSLYIADWQNCRVRHVGLDGIINTIAGNGTCGYSGDGLFATFAELDQTRDVAVGPNGAICIATRRRGTQDTDFAHIRCIDQDGIINRVAGCGSYDASSCNYSDIEIGSLATKTHVNAEKLAFGPDGNLYMNHLTHNGSDKRYILQLGKALPGFQFGESLIPSEDGREVYTFDYRGKHLRTTDALTGVTLYEFNYDANGFLIEIVDRDGNTTTIERDGDGNPNAIVGPYAQRTTLTLDPDGFLSRITNPASESWQFDYTGDGLLTYITDPNNNTSQYTYDTQGRLIRADDPAGGYQTFTRKDFESGYEVARTTALDRTTTYRVERLATGEQRMLNTFACCGANEVLIGTDGSTQTTLSDGTVIDRALGPDPSFGMQAPIIESLKVMTPGGLEKTIILDRTVSLAEPSNPLSLETKIDTITINGETFTSAFEASTNQLTITTPVGRQIIETLDGDGRIISKQVPGLAPIYYTYSGRGQLTDIAFGTGGATRTFVFSYDGNGNLSTVTDPLNRNIGLEYDSAGNLTKQITPDGREVLFTRDSKGNISSITPPGRPAHGFTYTPVNLMEEYVPPNVGAGTNSTVYIYNTDRQLTTISRPDGSSITLSYDGKGRLSSLTTGRGKTTYAYEAESGHLSSVITPEANSLSLSYDGLLEAGYTCGGELSGTLSQTYNDDFHVTSRSVNGSHTINLSYDNDGLLIQAGAISLARNTDNRLITGSTIDNTIDTKSYTEFGELEGYDVAYSGTIVFSEQYSRDKAGRVVQRVETVDGATNSFEYLYDLAGRLQAVKKNGSTISTYAYDSNGNRLTGPTAGPTGTYDNQDRLIQYGDITYTYTANGELNSRTDTTASETNAYAYDALGNLMGVTLPDGTPITYVIDGFNRRIGKKVNGLLVQGFLYKDQLNPVAELDGSSNVISRFVYASKSHVPDYMIKDGNTYRIVTDRLGSPRLVIDASTGAIVQLLEYDEFGNILANTNPGFQPFGFAGGLYDPDTKLTRFGARDYDAERGRWTSKDPIRFAGSSTNLYQYALNDPVNLIDSYGKSPDNSDGCWEHIRNFLKAAACAVFGPMSGLACSFGTAIDNEEDAENVGRALFEEIPEGGVGREREILESLDEPLQSLPESQQQ